MLKPETSKLRTSDHQTITFDVQSGSQRPIVLLHGLGQQRRFWDPVSAELQDHTIIRVDQRCHGESDTPIGSDVHIARCAMDVIEIIDRIDVKNPLIVGHSWGASIALSASVQAELDALLIDGAITPLSSLGNWTDIRPRFEPPSGSFTLTDVENWLRSSGIPDFISAAKAVSHGYRTLPDGRLTTKIGLERHMAVLDELAAYNPIEDFSKFPPLPCSVRALIAGELTESREKSVLDIKSVYPDLRVDVWHEAIHDVPLQFPQRIAHLISTTARGE